MPRWTLPFYTGTLSAAFLSRVGHQAFLTVCGAIYGRMLLYEESKLRSSPLENWECLVPRTSYAL